MYIQGKGKIRKASKQKKTPAEGRETWSMQTELVKAIVSWEKPLAAIGSHWKPLLRLEWTMFGAFKSVQSNSPGSFLACKVILWGGLCRGLQFWEFSVLKLDQTTFNFIRSESGKSCHPRLKDDEQLFLVLIATVQVPGGEVHPVQAAGGQLLSSQVAAMVAATVRATLNFSTVILDANQLCPEQ